MFRIISLVLGDLSSAEDNAAAAAASASASATSASASAASAAAAALSYDSFDDRYLGAKSSDPTLNNDGDALLTGALYFNTSANNMRVYNGSAWVVIDLFDASTIKPVLFTTISANTALVVGGAYRITAGSAVTVTLPASPASGDTIRIIDTTGANHVLARNGQTIEAVADDITLDTIGLDFLVWFDGTTWRFF